MRLQFFHRRRRSEVAIRSTGAATHAPFAPPPQPRELIEVIGLGRTETVSGVALTLLSLEHYREGDILNFRLRRERGRDRDFPSPELVIRVGPATAPATPRFSMMHGGGGGGMKEIEHRYSFGVSPGMPDGARDWVVEVSRIEWVRPRRSPTRVVQSVDEGPWRFVIRP